MYDKILIEKTSQGSAYLIRLKHLPKAEHKDYFGFGGKPITGDLSGNRAEPNVSGKVSSVEQLTQEQKDYLLEKLHHGQGDVSFQEWSDFLMDLEDLGLVSEQERLDAGCYAFALGDIDYRQPGSSFHTEQTSSKNGANLDLLDKWNGDPLSFMDALDLYLLKERCYANMDGYGTSTIDKQRGACSKVAQITRKLLF